MIRQYELVERVKSYEPTADEALLNRAYVFSMKAHGAQTRASGDPYFAHPIEVAGILTELKLDSTSIATALLHDTVEDTVATIEQINTLFGEETARLVDGVTKLSRLELQSDQAHQAENLRKFLLALSEDIRVLLVKLADRLHNMRTLYHVPDERKRHRIAKETMEIYAPLAERIGLQAFKAELEDLAFKELNPDGFVSMEARLRALREQAGGMVERVTESLTATLRKQRLRAEVSGREKRPYSIWQKMQRKKLAFEQLTDIVGFRVVTDAEEDCYRALGIVHRAYPMVPGRFKDYISTPKPNGYRSLHTTVIGPEQRRIEIQIRTRDMHEEAAYGVAAHWLFKQSGDVRDSRQQRWLRPLLEILDKAAGPEELLEHAKLEMFQDEVFCFSPRGALITLPRGATPVDFAYAVHTDVGDTTVGAKVNGRMVPLRTQLENGDQVEILRSRVPQPQPAWESFVVTGKARACIRRFTRAKEREQFVTLGRAVAEKLFREAGADYSEALLEGALAQLDQRSVSDLFAALGRGDLTSGEVADAVFPARRLQGIARRALSVARGRRGTKAGDVGIPVRGLIPGMAVHLAECCNPLPGERIVGIVTTGKGATIHTIDCDTLESFGDTPERWLDLAWEADAEEKGVHVGRLNLVVANETGSLSKLTTAIATNKGNISNLKITSRSLDFFEMMVDVEVKDVRHLGNIVAALRAVAPVSSVERERARH